MKSYEQYKSANLKNNSHLTLKLSSVDNYINIFDKPFKKLYYLQCYFIICMKQTLNGGGNFCCQSHPRVMHIAFMFLLFYSKITNVSVHSINYIICCVHTLKY